MFLMSVISLRPLFFLLRFHTTAGGVTSLGARGLGFIPR